MKSRKYLSFAPMAAAVALLIYWIAFKVSEFPAFEDLTEINNDNRESIGLAVDQISNANQFLISLVTTLFGVCGYFLNKHKSDLRIIPLAIVYVISLFLLAFAYYSAFKVYTSLVNSIGQNAIAISPGGSYTLFYIEEEFILCGGTSLILLSILIVVFLNSTKLKSI